MPLSLDLHLMLLPSISFPIKPSLVSKMVIHKLSFLLFFETKLKIANVSYKCIFISCWQANHYVHFNQCCSLRDSPHLKRYKIDICTLTYILTAQERRRDLPCNNKFQAVTVSFLLRAVMELFLILQSCILCCNDTEKCFCDIVHIKQDAKLEYLKH